MHIYTHTYSHLRALSRSVRQRQREEARSKRISLNAALSTTLQGVVTAGAEEEEEEEKEEEELAFPRSSNASPRLASSSASGRNKISGVSVYRTSYIEKFSRVSAPLSFQHTLDALSIFGLYKILSCLSNIHDTLQYTPTFENVCLPASTHECVCACEHGYTASFGHASFSIITRHDA